MAGKGNYAGEVYVKTMRSNNRYCVSFVRIERGFLRVRRVEFGSNAAACRSLVSTDDCP